MGVSGLFWYTIQIARATTDRGARPAICQEGCFGYCPPRALVRSIPLLWLPENQIGGDEGERNSERPVRDLPDVNSRASEVGVADAKNRTSANAGARPCPVHKTRARAIRPPRVRSGLFDRTILRRLNRLVRASRPSAGTRVKAMVDHTPSGSYAPIHLTPLLDETRNQLACFIAIDHDGIRVDPTPQPHPHHHATRSSA